MVFMHRANSMKVSQHGFPNIIFEKKAEKSSKCAPSNFEMCLGWVQILIMRLPVVPESETSICFTKQNLQVVVKFKSPIFKKVYTPKKWCFFLGKT